MCHKDASRFESLARIPLHCCAVTHGHRLFPPSSTDHISAPTAPPLPHARSARRGRTFTLPGVSAVLRGHVHSIRPFCILFWSHVAWHSGNAGIICSVIEMERCVLIGPSLNADVIPTPALSMLCQRLASPHGDLWSEPKRRRSIGRKCHGEWREMASTDFCRLSIARPAIISQE